MHSRHAICPQSGCGPGMSLDLPFAPRAWQRCWQTSCGCSPDLGPGVGEEVLAVSAAIGQRVHESGSAAQVEQRAGAGGHRLVLAALAGEVEVSWLQQQVLTYQQGAFQHKAFLV